MQAVMPQLLNNVEISVCIANYNGQNLLEECIESILFQDCDASIEIIVHDDASSDDSIKLLRSRFSGRINLIESKENVGFCVANNRMAAIAQGNYLLLLNNDATLMPDALSTLLNRAKKLMAPAILTLPQYRYDNGALVDAGDFLDPSLNSVPNLNLSLIEVGMVIGACLWIPRHLWNELGGFPEWFESIAEDLYLCCMARLAGYAVLSVPQSGFRHRIGHSLGGGKPIDGSLTLSLTRRQKSERNKNFVMLVTYPLPLLLLILPIHALLLLMEGLALSCMKHNRKIFFDIYFSSLTGLWKYRKEIKTTREKAMSNRRIGVLKYFKHHLHFPQKLILLFKYGIPQ
jgi:GT2 family glycosyltransferase